MKAKRPYTPKVRGCYQCSQRRIHCDRSLPNCAKCLAKNIPCSGLGVRYRFSDDVVRLKTSEKDKLDKTRQSGVTHESRPIEAVSTLQSDVELEDQLVFHVNSEVDQCQSILDACHGKGPEAPSKTTGTYDNGIDDNLTRRSDFNLTTKISRSTNVLGRRLCDMIDPGKRFLLLHFANKIASELVVIDDHQNGWRFLVLPLANQDDLIMDAVLSASASHFSSTTTGQLCDPIKMYGQTIQKLQRRQNLAAQNIIGKQTVLLALLVLLSTVMVSGCGDLPAIFRLLETALEAIGGEDAITQGELGEFVVRQIRKFRGYASPFLSQADGVVRLSLTASYGADATNGWECFKFYFHSHPKFSQSMSILYELNRQACDIYVARALAGRDGPPLSNMVQDFIDIMDSYPADGPGEHILVWATFMAAAESVLPEHQEYLVSALMKHHRRNGFTNLTLAVEYLRRMWSVSGDRDWTQLLPEMNVFVV